jgi:hypothetical protein
VCQNQRSEDESHNQNDETDNSTEGRIHRGSDKPAKEAARGIHRESPIGWCRTTRDHVPQGDDAHGDRGSTDGKPPGGGVIVWMPKETPGQSEYEHGKNDSYGAE